MSAVEVEIAEDVPRGDGPRGDDGERRAGPEAEAGKRRRRPAEGAEIEVEREITKRQIIQSVSTIIVVILYMVFTLMRDRETGVVVVDPDEGDDWDEGA